MKNKITVFVLLVCLALTIFTGCNYDMVDTTYHYEYAIIQMPNGDIVEGHVRSWKDYEDGEQLQVTIDNNTYLCSSYDCVLMTEAPEGK